MIRPEDTRDRRCVNEPFAHSFILRSSLTSRLLFLAEFLETRIITERVEHRIEPE